MATVYILYSNNLNRYYIGSCHDFEKRLQEHISKKYKDSFTTRTDDWKVFFLINDLDYGQARKIEKHIKRMKSKLYIENLAKYPEISNKLKIKYK